MHFRKFLGAGGGGGPTRWGHPGNSKGFPGCGGRKSKAPERFALGGPTRCGNFVLKENLLHRVGAFLPPPSPSTLPAPKLNFTFNYQLIAPICPQRRNHRPEPRQRRGPQSGPPRKAFYAFLSCRGGPRKRVPRACLGAF